MFKAFFQSTLPSFAGVLSGLLAYHYRDSLGHFMWHGAIYGISWHTKYFWPLGGPVWIVPATLSAVGIVVGITTLSARQIIPIRWDGLCDGVSVVGFVGFLFGAVGCLCADYVFYGCICFIGWLAILISFYADEWGLGNATV